MKNSILLLIIALFMVVFLGGCNGSKSTSGELTTIDWYMLKPIDNMNDQEIVEKEANKIFNKEIGVNLKFRFIDGGTWNEKMNIMASTGQVYDICFTSGWSNSFLTNAQRGAFLDRKSVV